MTIAPRQHELLGISHGAFHRMAYTEWGAHNAARTALCVHGLTRQGRDFDKLAMELCDRGYRVVCPDLVGRGRSDWLVDPELYAMPQYCADLTALIARLDVAEVDWIGTSLGGLIGMVLAGMPGTPVARLVVNDIGPYLGWPALSRIGSYLREMPKGFDNFEEAEAYFRATLAPFGALDDDEWRHLTEHSVSPGDDGSLRLLCDPAVARAFRPGLFYNLNLWHYWDAIACPTLVLRGTQSDLLLAATAKEMTECGPRARLIEFADVGHAPALLDAGQIDPILDFLSPQAALSRAPRRARRR